MYSETEEVQVCYLLCVGVSVLRAAWFYACVSCGVWPSYLLVYIIRVLAFARKLIKASLNKRKA